VARHLVRTTEVPMVEPMVARARVRPTAGQHLARPMVVPMVARRVPRTAARRTVALMAVLTAVPVRRVPRMVALRRV